MNEKLKAKNNLVTPDGEYTIRVWKDQGNGKGYWSGYSFEGRVLGMDNPKRGQVVQLPFGEMYKVANMGTIYQTNRMQDDNQVNAVFLLDYSP